jgi:hypothetical protein
MNSKDVIAFHFRSLHIPGLCGSISHALQKPKKKKKKVFLEKGGGTRHPGYKYKKWSILSKEMCEFNQIVMISYGLISLMSDFIE